MVAARRYTGQVSDTGQVSAFAGSGRPRRGDREVDGDLAGVPEGEGHRQGVADGSSPPSLRCSQPTKLVPGLKRKTVGDGPRAAVAD